MAIWFGLTLGAGFGVFFGLLFGGNPRWRFWDHVFVPVEAERPDDEKKRKWQDRYVGPRERK